MPLIFGETPSGLMVPVALNEDGSLIGSGQGWIGAAWQKDPIRLGYSGDKSEQILDESASAGTNILTSSAVPAGELWVVEAISGRNVDTAPSQALLQIVANSVVVILADKETIAANEYITWSGGVTLSEGDTIRAVFFTCSLNDDIYLNYHARRIDIDQ